MTNPHVHKWSKLEDRNEFTRLNRIEECRRKWATIAKKSGWYVKPFFVQVWFEADGVTVNDSVSFKGMTGDIILDLTN